MVDWTTVAISVLLATVASLVTVEYRIRRESSVEETEEVKEWYREARNYATEVKKKWRRSYDVRNPNLSEIKNEMDLFASQISSHATTGESMDVDEKVVSTLDELAGNCKSASKVRTSIGSQDKFDEARDDIFEKANKVEEEIEEIDIY